MSLDFGVLANNREAIWLAELGAILHNLGKMYPDWMNKFVQLHPSEQTSKFRYELIGGVAGEFLDSDALRRFQDALSLVKKNEEPNLAGGVKNAAGLKERIDATSCALQAYTKISQLFKTPVTLPAPFSDRRDYKVGDLLDFQSSDWYERPKNSTVTWFTIFTGQTSSNLTRVFQLCHHQASGNDKRSVYREHRETDTGVELETKEDQEGMPNGQTWKSSTVFGYEEAIKYGAYDLVFESVNKMFKDHSAEDLDQRDLIRRLLCKVLKRGVADSRIPIHDVRVSDMGFAAAAFFKASIAGSILQGRIPALLQWRMVRFCCDGDAYLERANSISDLVGREKELNNLFESIRKEVESERSLANEIYRDTRGPVYLLPVLDNPAGDLELLGRLRQWVGTVFAECRAGQEMPFDQVSSDPFALGPVSGYSFALGELLDNPPPPLCASIDIAAKSWNAANLEVCTVCGIRPIPDKEDKNGRVARIRRVCIDCQGVRTDRCKDWLKNQTEEQSNSTIEPANTKDQTIWIDELADSNGRVALISARFRLKEWLTKWNYIERTLLAFDETKVKPPIRREKSPSFARLARILDTTGTFWAEVAKDFRKKWAEKREEEGRLIDRRLLLKGDFAPQGKSSLSANCSYLLLFDRGLKVSVVCTATSPLTLVVVENLDRLRKQANTDDLSSFLKQQCTVVEPTGYGSENKTLGSFSSSEVEEWGEPYRPFLRISEQSDRLWMFCPADFALDGAKLIYDRYLKEMNKVRNRLALDIGITYFPAATPVRAAVDSARRFSRAKFQSTPWKVSAASILSSTVGGDPSASVLTLTFENNLSWPSLPVDLFFTNFERVTGNNPNDREFRQAKDIEAGDVISVEPSHFDYVYLEQAAERFEVCYAKEPGSTHYRRRSGGRLPYPLEQLPEFDAAWELLARLHTSQLKAIAERIYFVEEDWPNGRDDTYVWFARMALEDAAWPRNNRPTTDEMMKFDAWARNGVLDGVFEIRLGVEKKKPQRSLRSALAGQPREGEEQ